MTDWIAGLGVVGMAISVAVKVIVDRCLKAQEKQR